MRRAGSAAFGVQAKSSQQITAPVGAFNTGVVETYYRPAPADSSPPEGRRWLMRAPHQQGRARCAVGRALLDAGGASAPRSRASRVVAGGSSSGPHEVSSSRAVAGVMGADALRGVKLQSSARLRRDDRAADSSSRCHDAPQIMHCRARWDRSRRPQRGQVAACCWRSTPRLEAGFCPSNRRIHSNQAMAPQRRGARAC